MDEAEDSAEDVLTAAILDDLVRMRGSRCQDCGATLCGHQTLMSLVTGYKESPRCLTCLARQMGRRGEEVRDHLFGYIKSRPCRHAGWSWANREEGSEPDALPACLWPPAGSFANQESAAEQAVTPAAGSPALHPIPDAEWNAGATGCGELVMGLRLRLQAMKPGQILKVTATDQGVPQDLPAWCRLTRHTLVFSNHPEYLIQRRED